MLSALLRKLYAQNHLSTDEARDAFDRIFTGTADEDEIGAFLLALRDKGESVDEILGAVLSMRGKMVAVSAPADAIDIVGTGGDGRGTLNISTAAAVVVAGCGVTVAKHGNRAATGKSGSSDVLAALGVNLDISVAQIDRCLSKANLCFLFAPRHHPAMRHVAAVRKKLGVRTIFNLLGPLTNPANVTKHLIGVYAADRLRVMAEVLRRTGSNTAWLTHGRDGMDEISTAAASDVVRLRDGAITDFVIEPQAAGIAPPAPQALQGGDAAFNAAAIERLLTGEKSGYRDSVALNAAAALVVAGKAGDLRQGVALAAESLDSGAARDRLRLLISITNAATE